MSNRLTVPGQLTLLDSEAAESLAELLAARCGSQTAQAVLDAVSTLNSHEALAVSVLIAVVLSDDGSVQRGVQFEHLLLKIQVISAYRRRDVVPGIPKWLKLVEAMLAAQRDDDERAAAANTATTKNESHSESKHLVEEDAVLSATQAGQIVRRHEHGEVA